MWWGVLIEFSQLSLERDLVISELVESPSASVGIEEVGGASEEGEEASMVGRLIGLLGVSSSSLGADLLRTLEGRVRVREREREREISVQLFSVQREKCHAHIGHLSTNCYQTKVIAPHQL